MFEPSKLIAYPTLLRTLGQRVDQLIQPDVYQYFAQLVETVIMIRITLNMTIIGVKVLLFR